MYLNTSNAKHRHQSHTVIGQISCCDICGHSFVRKSHTQYKCKRCKTYNAYAADRDVELTIWLNSFSEGSSNFGLVPIGINFDDIEVEEFQLSINHNITINEYYDL